MYLKLFLPLLIAGILLTACNSGKKTDYAAIKAKQDYSVPVDSLPFDTSANKKVLFVLAHADDEISYAGTIARLKQMGATIKLITLVKADKEEDKQTRATELLCAVNKLKIDSFKHFDFYHNLWDDLVKNDVKFWNEHLPEIQSTVETEISNFQPYAVFVFDTVMGSYGHAEHSLLAKATVHAVQKLATAGASSVKKIYFSTLPKAMEEFLFSPVATYAPALERSKANGQQKPMPNIAYDIKDVCLQKKEAALCHVSQQDVLKTFYLVPTGEDSSHFNAFDREYYYMWRQ